MHHFFRRIVCLESAHMVYLVIVVYLVLFCMGRGEKVQK